MEKEKAPLRVGLMGFGQIGRMIYQIAAGSGDTEIVAIADIGEPHILTYLLKSESDTPEVFTLDGNYLLGPTSRARMLQTDAPNEVP